MNSFIINFIDHSSDNFESQFSAYRPTDGIASTRSSTTIPTSRNSCDESCLYCPPACLSVFCVLCTRPRRNYNNATTSVSTVKPPHVREVPSANGGSVSILDVNDFTQKCDDAVNAAHASAPGRPWWFSIWVWERFFLYLFVVTGCLICIVASAFILSDALHGNKT